MLQGQNILQLHTSYHSPVNRHAIRLPPGTPVRAC